MPHHPDCPQMGQLHTNGTFMDLGCVVGGGELRSASCSPLWCYGGQNILQTAKEREATATHCPRGREKRCPRLSAANPSSLCSLLADQGHVPTPLTSVAESAPCGAPVV